MIFRKFFFLSIRIYKKFLYLRLDVDECFDAVAEHIIISQISGKFM